MLQVEAPKEIPDQEVQHNFQDQQVQQDVQDQQNPPQIVKLRNVDDKKFRNMDNMLRNMHKSKLINTGKGLNRQKHYNIFNTDKLQHDTCKNKLLNMDSNYNADNSLSTDPQYGQKS